MKSTEIKKELSKKYNIPIKDIRIKNDHGWIQICIRDNYKEVLGINDFREERDFSIGLESFVCSLTDVNTYLSDDGYGTVRDCIMVNFDDFEYL